MKAVIFCSLLLSAIISCSKKEGNYYQPGKRLHGKLVIQEKCGYSVIQVLSGEKSLNLEQHWFDQKRNQTLPNLFTVGNWCTWNTKGYKEGEEFDFKVDDDNLNSGDAACLRCNWFYPTPQVYHRIVLL